MLTSTVLYSFFCTPKGDVCPMIFLILNDDCFMTKVQCCDIINFMYKVTNEAELIALGEKVGRLLEASDILILTGDLGTGKTTFTKGLAKGLDVNQMIKSPTYTIVREYEGRLPLYHLDVYRIGDDPDSIDLDTFLFGDGVTVIEWGEMVENHLPDGYLKVELSLDGQGRQLKMTGNGTRYEKLLNELK